jgi:phosphatidylinositol glycan class K
MLGKGGDGRVLHTDASSNVLVYWTGHGGDEFFKFQDVEEITATDIARLFDDMEFQELLFLADTCQAFTLGNGIETPGVYMLGSSLKGENSYAHHSDSELGLSVIERYTYQFIEYMKKAGATAMKGLSVQQAMVNHFDYKQQRAHVGVKRTSGTKPLSQVLMSDFFSNTGTAAGGSTKKAGKVELLEKSSTTSGSTDWSAWKALSS